MKAGTLISAAYELGSAFEAIEFCFEQGWTDGLPVVPPTESAVRAFLDRSGLEPDQVLGVIPERDRAVTAEKLAINAVMAGCKPEYMPVLVAAVEALTDPAFKFNHLASLGSPWPLMILSGPIVRTLGVNYGPWVIGAGCRPNATIGRALSLVVWNCAEGRIGGIQRGSYGHPGRFNSLCIGEDPGGLRLATASCGDGLRCGHVHGHPPLDRPMDRPAELYAHGAGEDLGRDR